MDIEIYPMGEVKAKVVIQHHFCGCRHYIPSKN
jgi:hypothetical protein